jgi:hypothetical protein
MYEFFNQSDNSYFYTIDENEKNYIEKNLSDDYKYKGDETLESVESDDIGTLTVPDPITGDETVEPVEVVRFFNDNGSHLYTHNTDEIETLQKNDDFTQDQNVFFAYDEQVEGSIPVYRFWDTEEDVHMFTHSAADKAEMKDDGYNDEGVAFYVMYDDPNVDNVEV